MATVNIEGSFALKEKKAYHSHQIKLFQLNEQVKMDEMGKSQLQSHHHNLLARLRVLHNNLKSKS